MVKPEPGRSGVRSKLGEGRGVSDPKLGGGAGEGGAGSDLKPGGGGSGFGPESWGRGGV